MHSLTNELTQISEVASPEPNFAGMITALVVLVVLSGFFSSAETAFTSLNLVRVKTKAEAGDKMAARTLALAEDYDKLLSTILIGNNIVNIAATTLATVLFTTLNPKYGAVIATAVLTVVILIFGEVSPKSLAKQYSEKIARFSTPWLIFLGYLLAPGNWFFAQWRRVLDSLFRTSGEEGVTEEEIVTLVGQAQDEGGLEEHEGELIRAAIAFHDMNVEDILTPRVDLIAVEDTDSMDEIANLFVSQGFSRMPVYHQSVDNIVGVIHQKDFSLERYRARLGLRGEVQLEEVTGKVIYTTVTTKIDELLRILQQNKVHMAVVVDEYGGTEGVVTLEDILEELVGEIWDEHDEIIEAFQKQEDGSYTIACSANLDDMFQLFSIQEKFEAATVSGWVMEEIGRIPQVGDQFQDLGLDVTVTQVENRRVLEIRVVVLDTVPNKESETK